MRFLITGGCGFLGSNIAAHLIGQGRSVIVFDNLSRNGTIANLQWLREQGPFEFVHGDVRHAGDVGGAVQRADVQVIFHLAGQVAMSKSLNNPREDFEINAGNRLVESPLAKPLECPRETAGAIFHAVADCLGDRR